MKILLVVTGLPDIKYPARSVFNLDFAKSLIRHGIDIEIVYLRAFNYNRFLIKERVIENIRVLEVPCFIPYINKFIGLNVNMATKYLDKTEVIHVINGGGLIAGGLLAKRTKSPIVSQFIGSDINIHLIHRIKNSKYMQALYNSNKLTFNSKSLLNSFEKLVDVNISKSVLYRGINLQKYNPSANTIFKKRVSLLFLGGFPIGNENLKGGITLLEALKKLDVKEYALHDFIIAGPNSKRYEYSFNHLNVKFLGALNRDEVPEYINASNVVLIPSIHEGVPNVLYESMASSKLVIASEVGGIPEVLTENCGVLVEPGSVDCITDALKRLFNFEFEIELMSQRAFKRVQNFSKKQFIDGYIDIYNRLSLNHG